jgi:hypothetical protein
VKTRAGHALFFRLRAPGGSSSRWRFRALFLASNFALQRTSIFRARIFVLLDFRARNFVLVRLYAARKGQQEQDRQNKTALTGEPRQNSQDMKARTGRDMTGRTGRTDRIGQ